MPDVSDLQSFSLYLPMRDGVRLAVQVIGQTGFQARRSPALVVFTRYGRAALPAIAAAPFSESQVFARLGFVVVSVDVRGTGASFGQVAGDRRGLEQDDCGEVFDWAAVQPWCDGRLFCTGVSYGGNVADRVQALDHPALVAVAPRFTDFDLYEHLLFPGGAPNRLFARVWGALTAGLDRGDGAAALVDGDADGALYRQALAEHAGNLDFAAAMDRAQFREDLAGPMDLDGLAQSVGPIARPAFHWASWMDAGTAAGALARFQQLDAPMVVRIGAWNHGAAERADPLGETGPLPPEERAEYLAEIAAFFAEASASRARERRIDYATLGRSGWRSTAVWPPAGLAETTLWLAEGGRLLLTPPSSEGADRLVVDFALGTGEASRWTTQVGTAVAYPDRREVDEGLLTYDSDPLTTDLEVTGAAEAVLRLASNREDGLIIAYLEAVTPGGRVAYLTEGVLRLNQAQAAPDAAGRRPFSRASARPVVPDQPFDLCLALLPTSAVIPAGWRVRLALAGADADVFARIPAEGAADLTVFRSPAAASRLVLPSRSIATPATGRTRAECSEA